jgi:hypothetical protein
VFSGQFVPFRKRINLTEACVISGNAPVSPCFPRCPFLSLSTVMMRFGFGTSLWMLAVVESMLESVRAVFGCFHRHCSEIAQSNQLAYYESPHNFEK